LSLNRKIIIDGCCKEDMDIRKIFRTISIQMSKEFEASSEVTHLGNRGAIRESRLKEFLEKGKLPKKYGIGAGEIISRFQTVSKQIDLIIYNQFDGVSLNFSDTVQVYPIECVYGTIEVKSSLSKHELIESLENIKSVKKLIPDVTTRISPSRDPRPFGIIFAYQLAGNSLDSLKHNLEEWEAENNPIHWPNAIVVLGEGIIFHINSNLKNRYANHEIDSASMAIDIHYRKDALFHFYSILIKLCSTTKLLPIELDKYFDPSEQIGEYIVSNHTGMRRGKDQQIYKLNKHFIDKIICRCKSQERITYHDLLLRQFGQIPVGMDQDHLDSEIYLFDPDNLIGTHHSADSLPTINGNPYASEKVLIPCHHIVINDEVYVFPFSYVTEGDTETIPKKTIEDL